ncbi:7032_t:CDS:2 [Ambispora gerdemannii]|uniref:7032_t:CDS:1 n=1 Tax=Ambispora gerdemannii TaxID=144530 RepID=A0A9N9GNQ6_9GLOM|nr:7032_t:CDS:2 [Ambispora gerdemannii]
MDLYGIAGKQNFEKITSRNYQKAFDETGEATSRKKLHTDIQALINYLERQNNIIPTFIQGYFKSDKISQELIQAVLKFRDNVSTEKDDKRESQDYSVSSVSKNPSSQLTSFRNTSDIEVRLESGFSHLERALRTLFEHCKQLPAESLLHAWVIDLDDREAGMRIEFELGRTNLVQHQIDTGDKRPIRQKAYRATLPDQEFIHDEVQRMLNAGIIRRSNSPLS